MGKGYKEIKNYIHNELGLTRQVIIDIITQEIKEQVKNRLVEIAHTNWIDRKIEEHYRKSRFKEIGSAIDDELEKAIEKTLKEEFHGRAKALFKRLEDKDHE